jgi:hypothetical protein
MPEASSGSPPSGQQSKLAFARGWEPDASDLPSERAKRFRVPRIDARHVYLRAIGPDDYMYLQLVETSTELASTGRFRGATPSPEQWIHMTWEGTVAQFIVVSKTRDQPVGIVRLSDANFQDGHARLTVTKFDPRGRRPVMLLGAGLFIDYVFGCWDLRKLYMHVPEYNFDDVASGLERFFVIEGRLRQHLAQGGNLWDQFLLAIYRDPWQAREDLRFRTL